jgi:hypothetical protein
MQDKIDATEALLQELEVLKENSGATETLRLKLSGFINHLITTDFEKLVQLLYRLDIDELKLKKTLQEHPADDAGKMISELIIERQLQKIKSRQQFSRKDNNIDEEEKW